MDVYGNGGGRGDGNDDYSYFDTPKRLLLALLRSMSLTSISLKAVYIAPINFGNTIKLWRKDIGLGPVPSAVDKGASVKITYLLIKRLKLGFSIATYPIKMFCT